MCPLGVTARVNLVARSVLGLDRGQSRVACLYSQIPAPVHCFNEAHGFPPRPRFVNSVYEYLSCAKQ
jgi:hypothetical protein